MKIRIPYFPGLLLVVLISFTMCVPKTKFSGKVLNQDGKGIPEALVEVGERNTLTNEEGLFAIPVDYFNEKLPQRYVLNITKLGYGFASKIYSDTASNLIITLTSATVVEVEVDPTDTIVVEDENPDFSAPLSTDVGTPASPLDTLAFIIDPDGKLIGFGAPPEISATYEAAEEFTSTGDGATVEVAADDLFDPEDPNQAGMFFQNSKVRKVTVSISTVDIYSPDGMPGDYTVRLPDGETRGYMQTFGAVDINFFQDGKPLQLRKGKQAKITIPINNITRQYYGKKLPETIPLLVYDKKSGEWVEDSNNQGNLNKEGTAYEALVSHFSVFNMDEVFGAGTACFKICAPASFGTLPASMEVSVPGHIKPFYPFANDCLDDPGCGTGIYAHAVVRMEPDSPMAVRISDENDNVRSTYVFIAGDASTSEFPPCPYNDCTGSANIQFQFDECWMNTDGTTNGPLLAVRRGVDLNGDGLISNDILVDRTGDALANIRDNESNYFYFNWVFAENLLSDGTISNSANAYRIYYRSFMPTDTWEDPETNVAAWGPVDFDIGLLVNMQTHPPVGSETTDWMVDTNVAFVGTENTGDINTSTASNTVIDPSKILVFRIDATSDGGTIYIPGTYYILNLPSSGSFFNSFVGAVSCYN